MKFLFALVFVFLCACGNIHTPKDYIPTGGRVVSKYITPSDHTAMVVRWCDDDGQCYENAWLVSLKDYTNHEKDSWYGDEHPKLVPTDDTKKADLEATYGNNFWMVVGSIVALILLSTFLISKTKKIVNNYKQRLPKAKVL
jgi:hypothetical protein